MTFIDHYNHWFMLLRKSWTQNSCLIVFFWEIRNWQIFGRQQTIAMTGGWYASWKFSQRDPTSLAMHPVPLVPKKSAEWSPVDPYIYSRIWYPSQVDSKIKTRSGSRVVRSIPSRSTLHRELWQPGVAIGTMSTSQTACRQATASSTQVDQSSNATSVEIAQTHTHMLCFILTCYMESSCASFSDSKWGHTRTFKKRSFTRN